MTARRFSQVDVFGSAPLLGNPVAVVHDAEGIEDDTLAAFARWTNLSETTFLLPPTDERADYRLRIFTPGAELPFAGHPTLGSAHAWLEAGGRPRNEGTVVQECGIGLVTLRRDGDGLSFAAPPLLRSGPVDEETLAQVAAGLRIERYDIVSSAWVDNGPGWLGVELADAERVLALRPDYARLGTLQVGVIGPHPDRNPADYEVRAFCPELGVPEDPVTGSLNAAFAVWLIGEGRAPSSYRVRQGTAMGRSGDVLIHSDGKRSGAGERDDAGHAEAAAGAAGSGEIWVGGSCWTLIRGTLDL